MERGRGHLSLVTERERPPFPNKRVPNRGGRSPSPRRKDSGKKNNFGQKKKEGKVLYTEQRFPGIRGKGRKSASEKEAVAT